MRKILVQACCGPCACSMIGKADVIYYNGNNMNTKAEYQRRLESCQKLPFEGLIVEEYSQTVFENCEDCIRHRLEGCAKVAIDLGFESFTTTLTVSPHKDTQMVNRIGREVSQEHGIEFIELNLKKNDGFKKSVEMSKQLGLYRQNYCGCARSVRK